MFQKSDAVSGAVKIAFFCVTRKTGAIPAGERRPPGSGRCPGRRRSCGRRGTELPPPCPVPAAAGQVVGAECFRMGRPFSDPSGEDEGTARIRTGEFGNAHQGLKKDLVAAVRMPECTDIVGVGAQIIEHKIPEAVGDDDPVGTLFERRQCPEIGVVPGAQPFVEPFAEIARQAPDPIVPVGVVAPLHLLRQLGDVQFGLHVRELPRVARFEEIVYLPAGA